jgi:hypothetical protein
MYYKAIIPVSLVMLVSYLNYSPNLSTTPFPTLSNCVPEQGARRHLCADCQDSRDAARFSEDRNDRPIVKTVFAQGRVGEWLVVGGEVVILDNINTMTKGDDNMKQGYI